MKGGGGDGKKTDELKHHKETQISTVTEGCLQDFFVDELAEMENNYVFISV